MAPRDSWMKKRGWTETVLESSTDLEGSQPAEPERL
jgi:hypothetical protein